MQYQSAYMSNQKAFNEKLEELMDQIRQKDEELRQKIQANNDLEIENSRLKEECNNYKGRMINLQRDVQVNQSYMQKMSTDTNSANEQFTYMKDRVRNLESELEHVHREKYDAACEVKRLT